MAVAFGRRINFASRPCNSYIESRYLSYRYTRFFVISERYIEANSYKKTSKLNSNVLTGYLFRLVYCSENYLSPAKLTIIQTFATPKDARFRKRQSCDDFQRC